ncbi:MAG TPA: hypothetical protein GX519_04645 [Thermoanaerobacterales bacterium]|nr:hypothetical protein [Thermoanaerobacterales bacterium]
MKKIISLEFYGGETWKLKKWAKTVKSVDQSKSNGYAFVGNFINAEQKYELEVGTYIMQYGEFYSEIKVRLLKVTNEGLEQIKEWEDLDKGDWALSCRDEIAEIINNKEEVNPLSNVSTEELIEELKRRGVK